MSYLEGYAAGLRAAVQNPTQASRMLDLADEQLALQSGAARPTAVDRHVVDDGYGPREMSR